MTTNNAQHALVWLLTVHSAARTGSRTHHRNPGLDIRAIFEEGRENAKFFWHVMARALVFEPRSDGMFCRLPTKYSYENFFYIEYAPAFPGLEYASAPHTVFPPRALCIPRPA
jgi:hypothetical protein